MFSTLETSDEELMSTISPDMGLVSQVISEIKKALKTGCYLQTDIAKSLGLGAKTLQRRLNEENYTFQALLDETRLAMAKDFLEQKQEQDQLSMDQISGELGFVEPRSFFRWFKKVIQQTPGEYRNKLS